MSSSPQPVHVLGHAATGAVLHPLRRRIMEELRDPDSAAGLSRKLGVPRQKLNYHLHALETAGLVELVEERKKGNCNERIVRATARSYLIDPEVAGIMAADPERIEDRFSAAYLVAVASRLIRDVSSLGRRAREAGQKIATLTLQTEIRFATAARRHEFATELATVLASLTAKYHDDVTRGGRQFRFVIGGYPAPRTAAATPSISPATPRKPTS